MGRLVASAESASMSTPLLRDCECGVAASALERPFVDGETDFRRCPTCGLVFRQVFPTENKLIEIYQQAYEAEKIAGGGTNQESGLYAAQSYAEHIRRHLPDQTMRVLDYGAGSGELPAQLRARGVHADGMEFSAEARHFCEAKRGFKLLDDLSDIPDGHYHWISMIEVIEHLTELQDTLVELRRVLAPDGMLFVTTPNLGGWRARKEGGLWHEAGKKFHLFLFNEESLRFHLARAGFEDLSRIYFGPLQRPGLKFWLAARITQAVGLGGTLCMTAHRSSH